MCIINIFLTCNGIQISIIVRNRKPGWRQCSKSFRICNRLKNCTVRCSTRHLMPCKVDRLIGSNAGKLFLRKLTGCNLGGFLTQHRSSEITNNPIFCPHFFPSLYLIDHGHFVTFFDLCQNRALCPAFQTNTCVPFKNSSRCLTKFIDNHYSVRILIDLIIHICVLLHKISRNICCASVRF